MKRALKITGIAVGSVLAVVVVSIAALLLLIDPNDYKPELTVLVKKKTDMDLLIADRLEWTLWPNIGVALGKTSLTDTAAKETLLAIDKAAVSVQLWPLFSRKIQIDAVSMDGAKVRFIQHADGSTSWDRLLARMTGKQEPEAESEKVVFNIKKLEVKNTSFLMSDEKAGVQRSVDAVTIKARNIGLAKAFPLALGFTFNQQRNDGATLTVKTALDASITLDQDHKIYDLNNVVLKTEFSGSTMPDAPSAIVKANIHADLNAGQIKITALDVEATYPAPGLSAPASIKMNADVLADLGKTLLSVNALTLSGSWPDATRPQALTAAMAATLSTNWSDGALEISPLAINAVVPGAAYPQPLALAYNGALTGNWKQGALSIPQWVFDAVGVRSTGALQVSLPAMAAAPTSEAASKPATPITKGMSINGSVNIAAFNPRTLMAALGMAAVKTADASVLKSASFSALVQGDEKKILLKNIRLTLDGSTLSGEAGINDLASMRQYARLTLDRMDADRYLPPAPAAGKSSKASADVAVARPSAGGLLPVTLLKTQNMDVALNAGSFKIMSYPVSAFRVAANASNGIINVSELKGSIFSGGFSVPATINVQGAQPVLRLQPRLDHMEIAPLAKKFLKKDLLEGKASYNGDLTVHGNSMDAWMKSVSGSSNLKFDNGLLHGVNAMKELMSSLGKYQGLLALSGKDAEAITGKQNDTEIVSFSAENTLSQGVVNSRALNADLKKARVGGSGSFNLVTQDLDYKFVLNLDKSVGGDKAAAYALPVQCKGNLGGNLTTLCKLDSKSMADMALKAATSKGLDKLLLKALGGSGAEAAGKDKASDEAQKTKDKLTEKLNEGLNKLFRR